MSVQFSLV